MTKSLLWTPVTTLKMDASIVPLTGEIPRTTVRTGSRLEPLQLPIKPSPYLSLLTGRRLYSSAEPIHLDSDMKILGVL